mmetsp:Transcript_837/g.1387  ORF Transcript_837/g.1387 Transcript_837/m.1387 type:complete len:891 (+) Transcript_837:244-2916(+)
MIKFTRSTKKKIDKVRSGGSSVAAPPDDNATNGSGSSPQHHHSSRSRRNSKSRNSQPHATTDHSVASAYSQRSDYTSETGYSSANNNNYNGRAAGTGGAPTGGGGGRSIAGSSVATNNSRRFSSAASVASISSASVFSPSVTPSVKMSTGGLLPPGGIGGGGGASIASEQNSTAIGNHHGLQPSSARLLRDLNNSARSSLLSSLGTAASRTFRSYKMTLPRCPPPVKTWDGSTSSVMGGSGSKSSVVGHQHHHHGSSSGATATNGTQDNEDELTLESDLELLGRTVHAVSSALTEPPKDNDRFMVYDVSFNPKGCVWDALIVVQLEKDDGDTNDHHHHDDDDDNRSRSSTRSNTSRTSQSHQQRRRSTSRNKGRRSNSRSVSRSRRLRSSSRSKQNNNRNDDNGNKTFSFPIRVTCAEDDIGGSGSNDSIMQQQHQQQHRYNTPTTNSGQGPHPKRAKTYAVDLAVIDDMPHHPISSWSASEAANYRDDMKNAMEWVSYGIRRSMARSMFPQFPEGCQGRPFREIYQLNKKLKSGTFSTVCRGVHRATGKQVAVKCILRKKIEPSVDAAVFEEVLIMSGLHHRYICPMIDYFEEDRCHFVVMELEKGGDLCERLNDKVTYSEPDARTVVRNICEAMEFVHNKGFAHCDIKPRNYLLRSKRDDVDVRLADFGFAQHVHAPNSLTSQCGTPFFVAPEVINRKPYDQKVDMWSIGVTTYLLLSGETPFNGKNRQQLFRRISCDEPTFSDDKWGNVSDVAIDFVLRLLTKDPAKRMSASEALRHEWFVGLDRAKAPMNASASMGTSEDFSIGTDHSKKSRDPPPQVSPTRKSSRASRPPPPPKPSSRRGDDRSSSDRDENARLLDVIKEQDAKIEKLEAMVKRMLEPEGAVHEC